MRFNTSSSFSMGNNTLFLPYLFGSATYARLLSIKDGSLSFPSQWLSAYVFRLVIACQVDGAVYFGLTTQEVNDDVEEEGDDNGIDIVVKVATGQALSLFLSLSLSVTLPHLETKPFLAVATCLAHLLIFFWSSCSTPSFPSPSFSLSFSSSHLSGSLYLLPLYCVYWLPSEVNSFLKHPDRNRPFSYLPPFSCILSLAVVVLPGRTCMSHSTRDLVGRLKPILVNINKNWTLHEWTGWGQRTAVVRWCSDHKLWFTMLYSICLFLAGVHGCFWVAYHYWSCAFRRPDRYR